MPSATPWIDAAGTAMQVPEWALPFYIRHIAAISALAAVPTVQRGLYVLAGKSLPSLINGLLDLVTLICRVLLFGLILELMYGEDKRLGQYGFRSAWSKVVGYTHDHWQIVVVNVVMFSLVFGAVNLCVSALTKAFGLSNKNESRVGVDLLTFTLRNAVTIPIATVWLCGIVRQMLISES